MSFIKENQINEPKLKINIFIAQLGYGGAERVVSDLSQYLSPTMKITLSPILDICTYNIKNADLFVFENNINETFISKILYHISRRVLFRIYMHHHHLKKGQYDLSVSFLTFQNIINMIVSHQLHIPTVVSIRNNMSIKTTFLSNISNQFALYLIKLYSPYLIVNSEENRKYLIEHYKLDSAKTICVYNPKDIDRIQLLQKEPLTDTFFQTDDIILLNVGRLTYQKGQIHLLRIFRELRKVTPCRLIISGVGELEASLKSVTHDLGIESDVLFTGWCDNPYEYMNRADIFVFPSLFEGQPNAMIEALICGCPIVSADCDYGPREILDGGKYGILTKKLNGKIQDPVHDQLTDSEQDMYEKILYLIEHPEARAEYTELSKERIGIFAKEKIIDDYFAVFKTAAEGRKIV